MSNFITISIEVINEKRVAFEQPLVENLVDLLLFEPFGTDPYSGRQQ
jgi:hypothetical protein